MWALVASAGGVDAVLSILGALPETVPAAVLVLIHQEPDRASRLVDVLARQSALPVRVAEHGATLFRGEVRVAPPGRHLLVTPGPRTALIRSGVAPPSRPSADLLLTTLAIACGSQATAVVLSGGGHDGATGATAVHDFGGTVIATDQATSTVFSMPEATIDRYDVVDHVVPLGDVAGLLRRLAEASPTGSRPERT